ncbi:MAG: hypothetical protein KTR31_40335 [Myxococcales bacterium]|nr:hypothetical protein [Myxococcales bacterium]
MVDRSGQVQLQTGSSELLWGSWAHGDPEDVHSWPTWSPDGTRLASFRIAKDGSGSRVWVSDVTGVVGAEVGAMGSRVPIYLQWSREGDRLAVLSQDDRELVLQRADPIGSDPDTELLRGSPLFFSWLPQGRLAAFVGEGQPAKPRLTILSMHGPRRDLPGAPGNFCAPVPLPRGLAYVAHVNQSVVVLVSSLDGARVKHLEMVDGLVALLASPTGDRLARAISPDGTGSPYTQLEVIDIETALSVPVTDLPCIAFFWLPDGSGLIVAAKNDNSPAVTWYRVGLDGSQVELARLVPSRDMRVYLRFFEQYGPSHPVVDPTGQSLLLCGADPDDADAPSRVVLVPLDGRAPEEVGQGLFACFGPNPTPQILEP